MFTSKSNSYENQQNLACQAPHAKEPHPGGKNHLAPGTRMELQLQTNSAESNDRNETQADFT